MRGGGGWLAIGHRAPPGRRFEISKDLCDLPRTTVRSSAFRSTIRSGSGSLSTLGVTSTPRPFISACRNPLEPAPRGARLSRPRAVGSTWPASRACVVTRDVLIGHRFPMAPARYVIPLSTEQRDQIAGALRAIGAARPCEACGSINFVVADETIQVPMSSQPGLLTGTAVPCAGIVCTKCGAPVQGRDNWGCTADRRLKPVGSATRCGRE